MNKINRREAREVVVGLLFEREFRLDEDVNSVYALACEDREIPTNDYINRAFFGVCDNLEKIDGVISKHSKGWRTDRLSKLSRSIIRLCVYEMLYEDEIPYVVSINEAVELSKRFDDDKARPFVNGLLHSVKSELEAEAEAK